MIAFIIYNGSKHNQMFCTYYRLVFLDKYMEMLPKEHIKWVLFYYLDTI